MNHSEAISTGAVERYLLGQLSASEVDEFEQHFFDCLECARELRAGALFEDNAKAVFLEERRASAVEERKPSLLAWLWQRPFSAVPATVALALAGLAAYQEFAVIPRLRAQLNGAQPLVSFALKPVARGDAALVEVPKDVRWYSIRMDQVVGSSASYLCSIVDSSGVQRFSVSVPAPPSKDEPIEISIARSLLSSGRYTVVVRNAAEPGKPETEPLARYPFTLKLD